MFCTSCGRPTQQYCIHHKRIHYVEFLLIIVYLLFLPSILMIAYQRYNPFVLVACSFSLLLMILSILEITFKKPYLATLFNCHMRRDRSSSIKNHYLPLCQRCMGISLGIIISIPFFHIIQIPFYAYIIGVMPMIIDGVLQQYYRIKSNPTRRTITGVLAGISMIYGFTYIHIFLLEVVKSIV